MKSIVVLIPVYNNVEGLLKSLRSINASLLEGFYVDVVVVDDGSSAEVILPSDFHFKFEIILIRQPKNSGIVNAMNAGLEYIINKDYEFIARLDAGDTVSPERFSEQVKAFDTYPDVYLVGTFANFVDMDGQKVYTYEPPTTSEKIKKHMYYNNAFCHPAVMFRSDGVRTLGMYSNAFPHAEDYEIFCRFVKTYKCINIPKPLVNVEINPSGISIQNRKKQVITRLRVQLNMFEYFSYDSYIGLLKTLSLMCMPYSIVLKIKSLLGKAG